MQGGGSGGIFIMHQQDNLACDWVEGLPFFKSQCDAYCFNLVSSVVVDSAVIMGLVNFAA